MGYLRELGISTGWVKPKPGEFLPEHQELGLAYQLLDLTFRDSRRELAARPDEEELVRDLLGKRIKERALRVTSEGLKASYYSPDQSGPHHLLVGESLLFSLKSQKLLRAPAPRTSFNAEELEEASSKEWFEHGMNVAKTTLAHLVGVRGLPIYLSRIELPR